MIAVESSLMPSVVIALSIKSSGTTLNVVNLYIDYKNSIDIGGKLISMNEKKAMI